MILITKDVSGQQKFFAGFYRDNSVCWTTVERNALDKTLGELMTIAARAQLDNCQIRERLSITPLFVNAFL